tara:strand:+ start:29 stop:397 length:369 start_codon:yes stop_codon:yes gene_type:complete
MIGTMNKKIKHYLKTNMVLSRYGRDLISPKKLIKNTETLSPATTKQTMVSKEEVDEMIEYAINRHNRNAGLISMVLGFTFVALFADGLFRVLGIIPPFLGIDVNVLQDIIDKVKEEALTQIR